MLSLTDQEREYLLEILESRYKEAIHELDHTDTREYKRVLRERLEIIEGLVSKLRGAAAEGQPPG